MTLQTASACPRSQGEGELFFMFCYPYPRILGQPTISFLLGYLDDENMVSWGTCDVNHLVFKYFTVLERTLNVLFCTFLY